MPARPTVVLLCGWLWCCQAPAGESRAAAAASEASHARERVPAAPAPAALPAPAVAGRNEAPPSGPLRFPGTAHEHDDLLRHLARATPRSLKPVGSTSTVFRMRLQGSIDGAFKTVTGERPRGPAAEVAAYRLARCLRLDNVPPAVSRRLSLSQLHQLLEPAAAGAWPAIARRITPQPDGTALGAAIYWIPDLGDVGVDGARGIRRFREWLRLDGELPAQHRELAASISIMLAFDYLIGNFDRFSGGNARGSADGRRIYLRDHDLSFPHAMPADLHRRLWRRLQHSERFSRRFYRRLKDFSRGCFELELARDPEGAAGRLLEQRQIDGVFDRHKALLSHIESLIELHGEQRVLVFE